MEFTLCCRLITSLLLQGANTYSANEQRVVFIRPEPLTELPLSVHGMYQMSYATVNQLQLL